MKTQNIILVTDFCKSHDIEASLLLQFHDSGHITIIFKNDGMYILQKELFIVEKIVVFYRDLNINAEGIEVVLRLLKKNELMNEEIRVLKNKLNLYK